MSNAKIVLRQAETIKVDEQSANVTLSTFVPSFCKPSGQVTPIIKITNITSFEDARAWQKIISTAVTAIGAFSRSFLSCINVLWIKLQNIGPVKKAVEKISNLLNKLPFYKSIKKMFSNVWNKYIGIGGLYVRVGDIFNTIILGFSIAIVMRAIYKKFRREKARANMESKNLYNIGNYIQEGLRIFVETDLFFDTIKEQRGRFDRRGRDRRLPSQEERSLLGRIGQFIKQFIADIGDEIRNIIVKTIAVLFVASGLLLAALILQRFVCKLDKTSNVREFISRLVSTIFAWLKLPTSKDLCDYFGTGDLETAEVISGD